MRRYPFRFIFIVVGFFIALGSLFKLLGYTDFSSDWFWFLAGVGLIVEGMIAFLTQVKFDRKYKVVER
jgi:hypothetical protein